MQSIHREALGKMVKRFCKDPFRFFGKKVPIYLGHPDEPNSDGEVPSLKHATLGYVKHLELKEEGLYAEVFWHRLGELELQVNEPLYFSPRWRMKASTKFGYYEPCHLLSLGLVRLPNLTGVDSPNLREAITFSQEMKHCMKTTSETLNLKLFGTSEPKRKAKSILNHIKSLKERSSESYLEIWSKAKRQVKEGLMVEGL